MIGRLGTSTRSNAGAVSRLGDGSLVSSGAWYAGALACWIAKGASSYAEALSDRTGNGYTLPTTNYSESLWTSAAGFGFVRGQNYYFNTGLTVAPPYTTVIRYSSVPNYDGSCLYSSYVSSTVWFLLLRNDEQFGIGAAPRITVDEYTDLPLSSGIVGVSIRSDGNYAIYGNKNTFTGTKATFSAPSLLLGRLAAGNASYDLTGNIMVMCVYDRFVDSTEYSAIKSAMAAL